MAGSIPLLRHHPENQSVSLVSKVVDLSRVGTHVRGVIVPVATLSLSPEPQGSLCRKEYLGQSPMIIAYYTENSSSTPDPSCLTHINYAHGRFVDKENGDGGIWIEQPEKLQEVVALKNQKPSLKVLLMIGGWGDFPDSRRFLRSSSGNTGRDSVRTIHLGSVLDEKRTSCIEKQCKTLIFSTA